MTIADDGDPYLVQTASQFNSFNSVATAEPGYSDGYQFTLSGRSVITALGYYDDDNAAGAGTAMAEDHQVGIYDLSGDLLLSATVTPAGLAFDAYTGALASPTDADPLFRYTSLFTSGVPTLAAGTYDVMGYTGADDYYAEDVDAIGVGQGLTYAQDEYSDPASGLTFATGSDGDPAASGVGYGIFGPDFQYEAAPVPETATGAGAALAVGAALLATAGRSADAERRRRRR